MTRKEGVAGMVSVEADLVAYRANPASASDDDLMALRQRARKALDRLDDEPEFEGAHRLLDKVGAFIREARPRLCIFETDGDDFQQTCPVALGHIRMGFSIEAEIDESRCSICHDDPWVCPHIPGRDYGGNVAAREVIKAKLLGVAMVSRPDMPDARVMSQPVAREEVEALLGGSLPPDAMPVCDRCLTECSGVRDRSI